MRGLDTNLLVRYLTRDDPAQFAIVSSLLDASEEQGERLFVNTVTLCELVWTLHGPRYRYERAALAAALERLLAIPLFEVQSRDRVREALGDYRDGQADFADYLIGWENLSAGCRDTVTFDTKLSAAEPFTVIKTQLSDSGVPGGASAM